MDFFCKALQSLKGHIIRTEKTGIVTMKIIYDEKTTDLINQLTDVIEQETTWLTNHWKSKGAGTMRVQTEISCNPRLNLLRNELARLYSIAMPVRYEFELEKE